MNFSPKIAVSAIILSTTLAMAAIGTIQQPGPQTIDFSVSMDAVANIDVQSQNVTSNQLLAATVINPVHAGYVVVETNVNPWDVTVNSLNGGKLKNASGQFVQYMNGATKTDAKLVLYVTHCTNALTNLASTSTTGCLPDPTKKITAFASGTTPTINATTAHTIGTSQGQAVTDGVGFKDNGADMNGALGTALMGTTPAPYTYFVIYAILGNSTGTAESGPIINTVQPGTPSIFEEKLTFTLVSRY
jgi:hypothetical protein